MNKKIVAIAIAAVLAAPMALQAAPTVYGKINFTVEQDNQLKDAGWSMEDTTSNFGIKGSEDLGNGLSAIYKIEYALTSAAQGTLGNDGLVKGRNTYVGLAGNFGTALLGRHDTPYKIAASSLDPFADTTADQGKSTGGDHGMFEERRLGSVIAYISPSMSGLTLAGAISLVETGTADNDADELGNVYSLAGMYSNGPIYASLGYEVVKDDTWTALGVANSESETRTRLGLGYTINSIKLAVVAAQVESISGVKDSNSTAVKGYATFGFGSSAVKLGFGQQTVEDAVADDLDHAVVTLGVDHNLSKATKVYAIYDSYDKDAAGSDGDFDTIALGLQHKF